VGHQRRGVEAPGKVVGARAHPRGGATWRWGTMRVLGGGGGGRGSAGQQCSKGRR
jgi:hypothetical protein